MARRIGLAAYSILLKKVREPNWSEITLGGPIDGWNICRTYLNECKTRLVNIGGAAAVGADGKIARCFQVTKLNEDKPSRSFWGMIDAGEYGRSSRIVDTNTEQVTHARKRHESDLWPYYFRIHFQDGMDRGILITQTSGHMGVKGALEGHLRQYLHHDDMTMKMPSLTDADVLEDYLTHGQLEALRVIQHKKPKDSNDILQKSKVRGDGLSEGTRIEVIIRRAKGFGKMVDTLKLVAVKKKPMSDLVEVYGLPDPEEVLAEVMYENRRKTLNISNPTAAILSYDITTDVKFGQDGHPTFDSIDHRGRELAEDIIKKLA